MPSGFRPGDFSALRRRNGYIKRVWCPPLDQPLDLIVQRDCVRFAPPTGPPMRISETKKNALLLVLESKELAKLKN
jgi:hypothetical protein